MSKLNKTQTYAIRWLDSQGLDSTKIAKELALKEDQVSPVVEKFTKATKAPNDIIKTSTAPAISPKNLMITETGSKKTKSVAIMTQAASELADEMRKKHTVSKSEKGIFRPKK